MVTRPLIVRAWNLEHVGGGVMWRCDGEGLSGFGRLPHNAYRAWRIQRDAQLAAKPRKRGTP